MITTPAVSRRPWGTDRRFALWPCAGPGGSSMTASREITPRQPAARRDRGEAIQGNRRERFQSRPTVVETRGAHRRRTKAEHHTEPDAAGPEARSRTACSPLPTTRRRGSRLLRPPVLTSHASPDGRSGPVGPKQPEKLFRAGQRLTLPRSIAAQHRGCRFSPGGHLGGSCRKCQTAGAREPRCSRGRSSQ